MNQLRTDSDYFRHLPRLCRHDNEVKKWEWLWTNCQNLHAETMANLRPGRYLLVLFLLPTLLTAQVSDQAHELERPVPILTGNAGFFTNVNGGETELVPSINPVLLLAAGRSLADRIQSRIQRRI